MAASNRHARHGVAAAALVVALLALAGSAQAAPPLTFQESTAISGLTSPTAIRFAPDGRVFVTEQAGLIKVYDNLFDPTPTIFADLRTQVMGYWDRGLLGIALDPQFPTRPYIYVSYALDAAIGATPPRWNDACADPNGNGCLISGRLSKLTASGDTMTNEEVLINDWCQQYPSHSIGALAFGADGALYMSGGDGASFTFADTGQGGTPPNPCADPSGEGGALRAQDLRTNGDPVGLNGSIIRVDPDTGAAAAGNPLAGDSDLNARRIVAHGFRNPFRFTIRPGTNELWVGDVGWTTWEEIDRVVDPVAAVTNFGWPCREGASPQPGYSGAAICQALPAASTVSPYYTYNHDELVVPGESGCATGSSSITGLAFYNGGSFPASYNDGLFFADYSRNCIWFIPKGANGLPDVAARESFDPGAAGPVDLQVGPGGDLFYADLIGGRIRRIRYISTNLPPTARASADTQSGLTPLTVNFDGSASSDPDPGDTLLYAWDLDGDGGFDDSTVAKPTWTYTSAGAVDVRLRVTDSRGVSDTSAPIPINVGNNSAPTATISSPSASTTWKVGDTINFAGSATDPEDGNVPASGLSWSLDLQHCPSTCHNHHIQDFTGVASGSFTTPDHDYPSHLELTLTARDSAGATDIKKVSLDPKTVDLTFTSSPSGLQLTVGPSSSTTPFTRTVIQGSNNSLSAPTPQRLGGVDYAFTSWSDGGANGHNITAGTSPATYNATYAVAPNQGLVASYSFDEGTGLTLNDRSGNLNNGTLSGPSWAIAGHTGGALSFDASNDWVTVADANSLDLTAGMTLEGWVRPTVNGTSWRTVVLKESLGNLSYSLYENTDTTRPSTEVLVGGVNQQLRGPAEVPLNAWTHLAASYEGTTQRLYVNGTQVATRAASGPIQPSTAPLRIGGNGVWPEWFGGLIDDVRVYNRALSTAEIQTDMNTPVGPPPAPDTQSPSAPPSLTATGSLGQASLSWGASSDDVGVSRYNVHRGTSAGFTPSAANRIAQPTGTSYTDSPLAAGNYYYRVIAEDAAGNLSSPSPEAQATVTADTTNPTVSITAPSQGATVSGTIAVNATASDDVGVVGVQFKLDGQNLNAEDTSSPYSTNWDTRGVQNGNHTLTAVARDAVSNTATSTAVGVNVQNTAQTPGPVASYSFDEGAGLTLNDRSGNLNNGTLSGPSWAIAGHTGGALSFDASNDWVSIADSPSLDLTTGMTLEAWVRPTVAGSKWRTVVLKEQSGTLSYSLYGNTASKRPSTNVLVNGVNQELRGPSAIALNAWTHLTATYDGTTQRLYVNGAQVASRAASGQIQTSGLPLKLGGNAVRPEWFGGLIDDVRVYNRALSATEIQADMNAPVS